MLCKISSTTVTFYIIHGLSSLTLAGEDDEIPLNRVLKQLAMQMQLASGKTLWRPEQCNQSYTGRDGTWMPSTALRLDQIRSTPG